jgi:hypothetical protein
VYRGTDAAFVPSAANLVSVVPAAMLTLTDMNGTATSWYRVCTVDNTAAASGFTAADQVDGPTDTPLPTPKTFALHPAAPNPFNPSTALRFDLPEGSAVQLEIVDASGRVVRRLVNGWRDAGAHRENWDGRDDGGHAVASGGYFARFHAGANRATRKLVLVR